MADGLPGGIKRVSSFTGHGSAGLGSDIGDNPAGCHFRGVSPLAAHTPLSFGGLVMVSGHAGTGIGADWKMHGTAVRSLHLSAADRLVSIAYRTEERRVGEK